MVLFPPRWRTRINGRPSALSPWRFLIQIPSECSGRHSRRLRSKRSFRQLILWGRILLSSLNTACIFSRIHSSSAYSILLAIAFYCLPFLRVTPDSLAMRLHILRTHGRPSRSLWGGSVIEDVDHYLGLNCTIPKFIFLTT